MDYVEACRACIQGGEALTIYGAFSNKMQVAAVGGEVGEGHEVDEAEYNKEMVEQFGQATAHREVDILIVCDRFETGCDNDKVCFVAVDKKTTSAEKLVQVYSRGGKAKNLR
mmetsp:Transcript_80783/g.261924  ORF Transcript_80783/g.261924 Transcript_80783/m.261924 type:complete len:112 (+) Transcript_80783:206-541(+)